MPRVKLHISTFLLALVLAVLVSFSALMCLVEAFSLTCDPVRLLAVCGAAALAAAAAMLPRKTWLMTMIMLAVGLGLIVWMRLPLEQCVMALLHGITTEYADVYGGIAVVGQAGDCLLLLSFLSVPFTWLTAWVICREGNALFLVLVCLPVLLLCLIIVDLAPVLWLVVLTFALLVVLLTHSVRERSAREGSRLAWWIILPVMILVTAITVIWPPADYTRSEWSEQLREVAENGLKPETLQELSEAIVPSAPRWNRELREVDLSRIGPKAMTGREVLKSKMDASRYYLRGASLGSYADNCWQPTDRAAYAAAAIEGQPLYEAEGTKVLSIETERPLDRIYTTYGLVQMPESAVAEDDVYVKNEGRLRLYHVVYGDEDNGVPLGYDNYVNQTYTQIPEDLHVELDLFLAQSGWGQAATPEELAAYVRDSAVYDLNTPRIPNGEDFVLYFLRESNRGYCVHFATATVMLLRAMDIPARYVTGYSVSGPSGEWVTVTEDDAHAWVEYYVNGVGWLPLEPTPSVDETEPVFSPSAEPEADIPEQVTDTRQEQLPEDQPEETPQEPETVPVVEKREHGNWHWLWLLALPAVALLILLRYWLGLRRRTDRCRRGHPNRRAMAYWRWLVQLARTEGTSLEEELICLAEKARFSQHTLSEEELEQLRLALEQRITRLRQYSPGKQLWFRFGLLLY